MEGIIYDIAVFTSPVAFLCGVALLAVGACAVLLGTMADEEAKGHRVFWAESPFTGIEEPAPAERVKYPKAA